MLKRTITYENLFTKEMVTEDHYFHISKADLVQMEMEENTTAYISKDNVKLTGMQAKLQRIVDTQDGKAIMEEIRDMVRRSYGKKDGNRFLKTPEIWDEFASTEAYSQLIWELCTDPAGAAEFMNGIIPSNLEQIAAEVQERAKQLELEPNKVEANGSSTNSPPSSQESMTRILTAAEIREMDSDELKSGLATGRYKLS
ncbi:MAG: hypothetical protein ACJ8BW_00630 [Ktedonobacteraceae bacterium]